MMRIREKKKLPVRPETCNLFCFSNIKTSNLHDELIEHRRVQPRMQALMGSIISDILQDIHQGERESGEGELVTLLAVSRRLEEVVVVVRHSIMRQE